MRFNLIILIFLFASCTANYTKIDNRKPYNAKGFAYIFNQADRDKNIIKGKMNNDLLEISHSQLKYGTIIKLINLKTKDTKFEFSTSITGILVGIDPKQEFILSSLLNVTITTLSWSNSI